MSNTVDRKRLYQDHTNLAAASSQPIQYDTQATFVETRPLQPSHEQPQQQLHEPREMDWHTNGTSPRPMNSIMNEAEIANLVEEIEQLRRRSVQMENRATIAENGYNELKHLKEAEAMNNLENYKALAEKRFKASQAEIGALQELTQHQEQHISIISSRMERSRAELAELKLNPHIPKQDDSLKRRFERYRKGYEDAEENVTKLQKMLKDTLDEIDEIQRRAQRTPQQAEAISTLERKMELYGLLNGMQIMEHKCIYHRDIYTIRQTGRNGQISFKLTFYPNTDGEPVVRYTPLLNESDGDILPAYMNDALEFPQSDIRVLFWRTTTLLNKKK